MRIKLVVTAAALTACIIPPALAETAGAAKGKAALQRTTAEQKPTKAQVRKKAHQVAVRQRAQAVPYSSYVHHPSYDVYVNGEYAGSDPDPRVRATIRKEWIEDQVENIR